MAIGGITEDSIKQAAQFAVLGFDPLDYLYTRDSLKRALIEKLSKEVMDVKEIVDKNMANKIAEAVGRLFKK